MSEKTIKKVTELTASEAMSETDDLIADLLSQITKDYHSKNYLHIDFDNERNRLMQLAYYFTYASKALAFIDRACEINKKERN